MSTGSPDTLLETYAKIRPNLERIENKLDILLRDILVNDKKLIHSIQSRTKDIKSLESKITKKEKYTSLDEITDLVGLRIITFFEEDTKAIEDLISQQFQIDDENSTDKSELLKHDQFGYLSVHKVCQLNSDRTKLPEYSFFGKQKFEIQIRSLLQHAWAEMQHDLGYKSKTDIPVVIRRRFASASALLEIQDREFNELRTQLKDYETKLPQQINASPQNVLLDLSSLRTIVNNSTVIKDLDQTLAKCFGQPLVENPQLFGTDLKRLLSVNIDNIAKLEEALKVYKKDIELFAPAWLAVDPQATTPPPPLGNPHNGISLYYLFLTMLSKMSSSKEREDALAKSSSPKSLIKYLIARIEKTIQILNTKKS